MSDERIEIRALATDPDVVALRVERIRSQVDVGAWISTGLRLAFTAVNVQTFAAAGAPAGSPGWLVAWLLDPMVASQRCPPDLPDDLLRTKHRRSSGGLSAVTTRSTTHARLRIQASAPMATGQYSLGASVSPP